MNYVVVVVVLLYLRTNENTHGELAQGNLENARESSIIINLHSSYLLFRFIINNSCCSTDIVVFTPFNSGLVVSRHPILNPGFTIPSQLKYGSTE